MKAEVVLGDVSRLKATAGAGVEVIAVAERAFGLGVFPPTLVPAPVPVQAGSVDLVR
jgi:hypothetical protein